MRIVHLLVVTAVLLSAACQTVTVKVPGTLDMRSDGAGAPAAPGWKPLDAKMARTGFDAIIWGEGVTRSGPHVTVKDRRYWALRLVPIANESATEEIAAAIGDNGALKKVQIGDGYDLYSLGIALGGSIITSFVGLSWIYAIVMPPWNATFEGDRISTGASSPPDATLTP